LYSTINNTGDLSIVIHFANPKAHHYYYSRREMAEDFLFFKKLLLYFGEKCISIERYYYRGSYYREVPLYQQIVKFIKNILIK
jgi:hypothetical protein